MCFIDLQKVYDTGDRTLLWQELAMDYVRRAVWGMLYADDACIVS